MGTSRALAILALVCLSFAFTATTAPAADWRSVTDERLLNAGSDADNWLMYNRTYNGWRYSPLDQINTGKCHGVDARGTAAAANLQAFKGAEADFLRIVRDGRPGTGMTSWKGIIGDEDILNIARYVKHLATAAERK
jgi:cytochrome c553